MRQSTSAHKFPGIDKRHSIVMDADAQDMHSDKKYTLLSHKNYSTTDIDNMLYHDHKLVSSSVVINDKNYKYEYIMYAGI